MRTIELKQSGTTSQFITASEVETYELAREFVRHLKGGEVIALSGELGAGKTTFVKGVAEALDLKKDITSPTFVLMKVYPVKHESIKTLVHIDAYRLSSGAELEALGATDFIGKEGVVTFIEWPERVSDILPSNTVWVSIEHGK